MYHLGTKKKSHTDSRPPQEGGFKWKSNGCVYYMRILGIIRNYII